MRFSGLAVMTVAVLGISPMLVWAGDIQNTPANDPNRVVCKIGPPPTGSRIGGRRICLTQQQWDMMQQEAQKTVSTIQNKGQMAAPPGGGN